MLTTIRLSLPPQTANGNVEAKVVCLFRRRDISGNLNTLADSNASE
jgi:metastasis-associated protein MTA